MLSIDAVLKLGDGAGPEVFTEVINATSLNYDGKVFDTAEITAFNSAGNKGRKYVSTLYKAGNVTFTLAPFTLANTQHAQLINNVGETVNVQYVLPDGLTYEFATIIQTAKPTTTVDGVYGFDITLMGTGEVSLTS